MAADRVVLPFGSSPLARGLQVEFQRVGGQVRIIPARAGFTFGSQRHWTGRKDHPRSRGVYMTGMDPPDVADGSSPLARGLQRRVPGRLPTVGIIPARAGFTRSGRRRGEPGPDHPRSRGVYHSGCGEELFRRRIIPARAGFTTGGWSLHSSSSDHPRSRGVYLVRCCSRGSRSGSSPLARGLHSQCPLRRGHPGIIPARAGFTAEVIDITENLKDHPRSRGVYPQVVKIAHNAGGSSPLARGLLSTASAPA